MHLGRICSILDSSLTLTASNTSGGARIEKLTGNTQMQILVADDQPKVRFALRVLLGRQPGLNVAGEVANAEDLLIQVETICPDLVLLGWELPGLAAKDTISALRETCPRLFVIALSGRSEARRAALDAGANIFVSKGDPPERLLVAIENFWDESRLDLLAQKLRRNKLRQDSGQCRL
jgi:DNA-binding NarL/FixJ family response regulator